MTEEQMAAMADEIYREKVLRARELRPSVKMGAGAVLFAEACGRMRAGIRHQFPEADEKRVEEILRERLERLSRLHDFGICSLSEAG